MFAPSEQSGCNAQLNNKNFSFDIRAPKGINNNLTIVFFKVFKLDNSNNNNMCEGLSNTTS